MNARGLKQVGALPYRRIGDGKALEFLLVSTRRTGRWIIPKGNIDAGHDERSMVAIEAMEEAGVEGKVHRRPIGTYGYIKYDETGGSQPSQVAVYPLAVRRIHDDWLEMDERTRLWVSAFEIGEMIEEPDLVALILTYAASLRRK